MPGMLPLRSSFPILGLLYYCLPRHLVDHQLLPLGHHRRHHPRQLVLDQDLRRLLPLGHHRHLLDQQLVLPL